MLLNEVVAKAYAAPDPTKDLLLDSPFQKVGGAWREVASPREAAVGDFLQQHEPPTPVQPKQQPKAQPKDRPNDQPKAQPKAQPG